MTGVPDYCIAASYDTIFSRIQGYPHTELSKIVYKRLWKFLTVAAAAPQLSLQHNVPQKALTLLESNPNCIDSIDQFTMQNLQSLLKPNRKLCAACLTIASQEPITDMYYAMRMFWIEKGFAPLSLKKNFLQQFFIFFTYRPSQQLPPITPLLLGITYNYFDEPHLASIEEKVRRTTKKTTSAVVNASTSHANTCHIEKMLHYFKEILPESAYQKVENKYSLKNITLTN